MFRLQIATTVLTSVLLSTDFTLAKINGGQIDTIIGSGWLLSMGWLFGTAVRDAWKRNGNGNGKEHRDA